MAIKMEADLATFKRDDGIVMAFQQMVSAEKSIYWSFKVYE